MRLRFVFFYVIFHENTFFLETGIERRWVKNSFNTGVFLGFVFFEKWNYALNLYIQTVIEF